MTMGGEPGPRIRSSGVTAQSGALRLCLHRQALVMAPTMLLQPDARGAYL